MRPKGNRLRRIILLLVAEADRLQLEERFAGFVHRFDVVFIPARGDVGSPKSAAAIYGHIIGVYPHNRLHRVKDVANASGVILASNAMDAPADADIAVARKEVASCDTNGRVTASGRVVVERVNTDGRVVVAGGVVDEGKSTRGRVADAVGVTKESLTPGGSVVVPDGVVRECVKTVGRVVVAVGVG